MSQEIVLYDLARRGERVSSWSANVWKTRLALNYKGLPYRTVFLTHENLQDELKTKVSEPNAEGSPYTVPTVILPDGKVVMESGKIARELEKLQPSPSLHLNPELPKTLAPIMGKVAGPLRAVFMPRVARDVLVESSVDYFLAAREKMFGMPLFEVEKQSGGEPAWQKAEPGIRELAAFIKNSKKDQGPFVLGSQVSYADLTIAALFEGFRRIGQDLFERLVSYDEAFVKLYEACKPWMKRDD